MESSIFIEFLYLVGAIQVVYLVYSLSSFIYIYLRPSALGKYLHTDAYAFVTGASDGIGKAIAVELAKKGFNLIIHGRNADKLNAVRDEIFGINESLNRLI